ncbi:unnamed protein product [Peniophora sp. CBMAI 1063]|nr:unnamed protein product [Peniophora sp. CBMAI 1063]
MFGLAPVCTLALLAASGIAGPVRTKTALDAHPSSTMAVEARYESYGPPPPPPAPSCNTGELQCCNSVQDSSSKGITDLLDESLLSLLPLGFANSNTQVGVTCDPIVPEVGAASQCNQQTVCCDNTSFQGIIALGCMPINLAL